MLFVAFPLLILIFFSLSFIFVCWLIRVNMFLLVYLYGMLHFLDWVNVSFLMLGKYLAIIFFKYFLILLLSLAFWVFYQFQIPRQKLQPTDAHVMIVVAPSLFAFCNAPKSAIIWPSFVTLSWSKNIWHQKQVLKFLFACFLVSTQFFFCKFSKL